MQHREIIDRLCTATRSESLAALARWLDIDPTVINRSIRDRRIPDLWIYKVAAETGYLREWLLTGTGPRMHPSHAEVIAEALKDYGVQKTSVLPILSWVQAGALRSAEDLYPYAGAAEEYLSASVRGRHCFVLKVRGESMLPDFREGDMIVVDPDLQPQSGDLVVVVIDGTGEATFKRYLKKRDGEVLMPINPEFAPIVLQPEHRIVGKVIQMIRML